MSQEHFLSSVDLFIGLEPNELVRLEGISLQVKKPPGDMIYCKGQWAENLFLVVEGQVDLRYEIPAAGETLETTISKISQGGTFGWSALAPPYRYTHSSYAAEQDCRLLRLTSRDLIRLFENQPRIGYIIMRNLARVISKRFHDLEDQAVGRQGVAGIRPINIKGR